MSNENYPTLAAKCPIVAVGASAGGLEAFADLLKHLPPDLGAAVVLVLHLSPDHESIVSELLPRWTSIPVTLATERMRVEPNHIYVIPPATRMIVANDELRLEPRAGLNHPIDYFFRSLAKDLGKRAIAVVLSGMGTDGTLGAAAIAGKGGVVLVQSPDSARQGSMPRSAMEAGYVDAALPPAELAAELARLCRDPYFLELEPALQEGTSGTLKPGLGEILSVVRTTTGMDFAHYKQATVMRRIERRAAFRNAADLREYAASLREDRDEVRELLNDLLINVTEFFREPETFDILKQTVLPQLLAGRAAPDGLRVWVPGCSTGEEVYSLAISLVEYMNGVGEHFPVQVFGTDISEPALTKARAGRYPEGVAADIAPERLRNFFSRVNGQYEISKTIREMCLFARQNVVKDPPFSHLDLISCRNLLIYLDPILQDRALRLFQYGLKANGYLILGSSDSAGRTAGLFEPVDGRCRIYARLPGGHAQVDADAESERRRLAPAIPKVPDAPRLGQLRDRLDQLLLGKHKPAAVLMDENLEVLHVLGETTPSLEPPSDEAMLKLIQFNRSRLDTELRKLAARAAQKPGTVHGGTLQLAYPGEVRHARLSLTPIVTPSGRRQYLVVFEEVEAAEGLAESQPKGKRIASRRRVAQLEDELLAAREYLELVLEEHQAAIEELRSSSEEIQSSSEELQSTNEELLTAKEELQSTNEELNTVNEELRSRNWELNQTNNDLVNLLASVNIPILMVDDALRVRRFTPQAEKLLNLQPIDVGRPISDLRPKIDVPRLDGLLQQAIDILSPVELDVRDSEGKSYSMSIRPYRTTDNRIAGAVMVLFDVTERKRAAEARYARLFEAATDGILIADAKTGEILDVNPFLLGLLGRGREDLVNRRFSEADPFRGTTLDDQSLTNLDKLGIAQRELTAQSTNELAVALEVDGNSYSEGDRKLIRLNIRDVTDQKQLEERLRRSEEHVQRTEKMEAIGQLTSGLAHDFNNLMTAIIAQCQLLQMDRDSSDPVVSEVQAVITVAARAAKLTQQLLAFGRKQALQPSFLQLKRVLADMKPMIDAVIKENVNFQIKADSALGTIRADRGQIEQVILNLVLNARDAMPGGGRITAETEDVDVDDSFATVHPFVPPGPYVRLRLADTGTGMSREVQAHLFEPFFTTKPRGIGTGLGLSTTYGILQQSGAHILVDSELGRGTAIDIYFPRIDEQAWEESPEPAPLMSGDKLGTLLLVEDDEYVRVPIARTLRKVGYTVLEAAGGPEALQVAESLDGTIDLLVTDVVMPGMSGKDLADQLSTMRLGLKVLYISGYAGDVIGHQGVRDGGAQLLPKPFTVPDLLTRVAEVLNTGDGHTGE